MLNFSHLNKYKLQYNFKDTIDPMCSCSSEPETTFHCLLCYNLYCTPRVELLMNTCTCTIS